MHVLVQYNVSYKRKQYIVLYNTNHGDPDTRLAQKHARTRVPPWTLGNGEIKEATSDNIRLCTLNNNLCTLPRYIYNIVYTVHTGSRERGARSALHVGRGGRVVV